jgi:hypothetical protein
MTRAGAGTRRTGKRKPPKRTDGTCPEGIVLPIGLAVGLLAESCKIFEQPNYL